MMRRALTTALLVIASCVPVSANATAGTGHAITLILGFQAQGPIARIAVRPGDHVRAGQLLAQVDASKARIDLATAEAGMLNARAALLHLTIGPSGAELRQNRVALVQAKGAVRAAVRARADGAAIERRTLAQKRHALAQARLRLTIAEAASAQSAAVLQAAVNSARAQLATATDAEALRSAQEALTNAINAQAAGDISGRQATADATGAVMDAANDLAGEITSSRAAAHQAAEAVRTARLALRATAAANAVAAQRPRPDAFVQARAGVQSAQASLAAARLTLAQTELRAPAAGTIVAINGHVGETPGQGDSSGSGGGAAFITMITLDGVGMATR